MQPARANARSSTGTAFASAHGAGAFPSLATATGWRDHIFSTEIFLLVSCGGALLVNRMVLRQRRLLDELAVEHEQLRHYAPIEKRPKPTQREDAVSEAI